MMINTKTVGQSGQQYTEVQTSGISAKGFKNTLADAVVAASDLPLASGLLIVEDSTNNEGAVISVHLDGGTPTLTILNGGDDISIAKDTAAHVNVYVEGGKLNVQNLSGGEAVVSVKTYA